MNKFSAVLSIGLVSVLFACSQAENTSYENKNEVKSTADLSTTLNDTQLFFEHTMNVKPFLPNNQSDRSLTCALPEATTKTHSSSENVDYTNYGWEKRIAHDWRFFDIPAKDGRILIIDIKQQAGKPAYRYLANNTQTEIYEPWSSSKIFAYTGAMAQLRKQSSAAGKDQNLLLSQGIIGEHHIADMITSINSYDPFGRADGNSNALATFFANLASRDYLSQLFYDEWLKLSAPNISFRGAYGPSAFIPNDYVWKPYHHSVSSPAKIEDMLSINMNNLANEDKGYLAYRCDTCGLTGNKPMTTLAQAEWLKRLAMHSADPVTAHPELLQSDVDTLFYGTGNSNNNEQMAGMTLGISTMLQQAIAKHIDAENTSPQSAKQVLDKATAGDWRVFQKIGWGPSETRSTSENVVLAYVCLPEYQGGRSFVVAAQVAVPVAKEENVAVAGLKMQSLLDSAIDQYLDSY